MKSQYEKFLSPALGTASLAAPLTHFILGNIFFPFIQIPFTAMFPQLNRQQNIRTFRKTENHSPFFSVKTL